jgi:HK97 family phage major capsid protein
MREKLLKDRAALIKAMEDLMAKAETENRALTADEQAMFDTSEIKVKDIDATLERLDKMPKPASHGLEARGTGAQVRDRGEDKPWGHVGEFFAAVAAASQPERSRDPRLKFGSPEDGFAIPMVQRAVPRARAGETVQEYMGRVQELRAASGLNETVLSQGGFLVQQDVSTELIQRVYDTAVILPRCRRLNLGPNSNGMKLPYVDETSRATGSRMGGVRGYWADEADEKTASKPKLGRLELNLKKLVALCYATDELMQDSVALGGWLEQAFAEEMAFMADDSVINGTGVGQPLGILNAACRVDVAKETSQAADTIKTANIAKMWSRMWVRSKRNSVWLVNGDAQPQLMQMTVDVKNVAGSENVGGSAAYLPPGGLNQSPYGMLLGRPVVEVEQCATIGDLGDIILADLSSWIYIARDLQMANSIHVRFIYDETAFRFVYRIDGQPAWKSALTPYKGTNTVSPFVALAAR